MKPRSQSARDHKWERRWIGRDPDPKKSDLVKQRDLDRKRARQRKQSA